MREIVYHRNAARSMRKIPVDRRNKVKARIEEVATLESFARGQVEDSSERSVFSQESGTVAGETR